MLFRLPPSFCLERRHAGMRIKARDKYWWRNSNTGLQNCPSALMPASTLLGTWRKTNPSTVQVTAAGFSVTTKATVTNTVNREKTTTPFLVPTIAKWKIYQEVTEKLCLAPGARSCVFSKQQKNRPGNTNSRSISTHDSVSCHAGGGVGGEEQG